MSHTVTPAAATTGTEAPPARSTTTGGVTSLVCKVAWLLVVVLVCEACTASPDVRLTSEALRIAKALVREVEVACGNSCQPIQQAQHLVNAAESSGPDVATATAGPLELGWDKPATVTLRLNPAVDSGGFDSGTTSGTRCIAVTMLPRGPSHGTSVEATYAVTDC